MHKKILYTALITILIITLFASFSLAKSFEVGDRGSEVKKIQEKLSWLGYDVGVDGIYGSNTEEIIKEFQENNELTIDGIAGSKTIDVLKEMTESFKYEIKKGDSLSEIAVKFETSVDVIKEINNLDSNKIVIGDKLKLLKTGIGGNGNNRLKDSINYKVERGDSLLLIALEYGSSVKSIMAANNLSSDKIYEGQTLVIPINKDSSQIANRSDNRSTTAMSRSSSNSLSWPVKGRISSRYGYRTHPISHKREFHGGIDIAVPTGTKIKAAASGKVVWSGWAQGFGKTIIIEHGNGKKTLYGHNSKLLVRSGSRVSRSQVIARAGSTGRSTGPHLDFRIYINGETENPINHLP